MIIYNLLSPDMCKCRLNFFPLFTVVLLLFFVLFCLVFVVVVFFWSFCFFFLHVQYLIHAFVISETGNINIQQCLDLFTEPEILNPEEAWYVGRL